MMLFGENWFVVLKASSLVSTNFLNVSICFIGSPLLQFSLGHDLLMIRLIVTPPLTVFLFNFSHYYVASTKVLTLYLQNWEDAFNFNNNELSITALAFVTKFQLTNVQMRIQA